MKKETVRKIRIITAACWIVSAVLLVGLAIWFIAGPVFNLGNFNIGITSWAGGAFEEQGRYKVPIEGIDSMSIHWTAGAVTISPHAGDEIQITEFSQRRLRDNQRLQINTSDGTVRIDFTAHQNILRRMPSKQLEVQVPYALIEHFDDFSVETVSGRIELRGLAAQSIRANTTSGRIEMFDVNADTLSARTTSGRIAISDTSADTLNVRTVSGRIDLFNTQAYHLDTHTTSGRHELSGGFDHITARSVSGRIEIISTRIPAGISANATSGRIAVTVPDEGEPIAVQYSSTSGRFTSEIPIITHSDDPQFRLSTTSGRITIYTLR